MDTGSQTTHWRTRWLVVGAFVLAALVAAWLVFRAGNSGAGGPAAHVPQPVRLALVYSKAPANWLTLGEYAGQEDIYRANVDGSHPTQITKGLFPTISPDGKWIAYEGDEHHGQPSLLLLSLSGGKPHRLAPGAPDTPVWSADSRFIASEASARLAIKEVETGGIRTFRVPQASYSYTFSPDDKTLAFSHSTGKGTYVLALDLTSGHIHPLTSDGRSTVPLWGPNGIAFERHGVDANGDRCGACHGDVWMMKPDGSDQHALTHTKAGIQPAAWSADGSHLLAAYPAMHNGKLYAVDTTTGTTRALTDFVGDLYAQGLSRDGKTVLAAIGCGGMTSPFGLVETIPFAGGKPTVIARGPCRASWNA